MPCPYPVTRHEVSGQPSDEQAPASPLSPRTRGPQSPGISSPQSSGVQVPSHRASPLRKRSAFTRLGAAIARYHRLVVAVWIIVVVVSAILVPRFQSSVTGPPLDVLASESYRAQEILATRFDQPFAEQDLVVFESESLVATDLAFQT